MQSNSQEVRRARLVWWMKKSPDRKELFVSAMECADGSAVDLVKETELFHQDYLMAAKSMSERNEMRSLKMAYSKMAERLTRAGQEKCISAAHVLMHRSRGDREISIANSGSIGVLLVSDVTHKLLSSNQPSVDLGGIESPAYDWEMADDSDLAIVVYASAAAAHLTKEQIADTARSLRNGMFSWGDFIPLDIAPSRSGSAIVCPLI